MMNIKMAALAFAGLMLSCSLSTQAAESSKQESTLPPAAIPGINQAQSAESNEEKANKKGEEASGSNSGADSQSLEKEATSSDDGSTEAGKEPES